MKEPTAHEMAVKLAALEERMKTMQAEYKTDIAMLAAENAKRDKANIQWMVGLWIAAVVVIIAVLGFMINAGT